MSRNTHASYTRTNGFGVDVFSREELYAIHCATLDVLEHVGVRVDSKNAQGIFA